MAEKTVKLEDPANNRMGSAKMLPLILTMALPAMFSMLIQALYNIVDSYFVAQVSQNALTAVSLAFPIQNLLVAFGVGTGVGVSSLISRRLGERDQEACSSFTASLQTLPAWAKSSAEVSPWELLAAARKSWTASLRLAPCIRREPCPAIPLPWRRDWPSSGNS